MAAYSLDTFQSAYGDSFPYHLENLGLLKAYSAFTLEAIDRRSVRTVLSLGIGHAVVAQSLAGLIPGRLDSYLIVEGSPAAIQRFQASQPDFAGQIVHSLFEAFETDRRFDLVEMGFVLEHVADPHLLLRRFQRFLAPGGSIVLAVPNALSLHRRIGYAAGLLSNPYELSEHDRALGHVRYFDHNSLALLVEDCGLKIRHRAGLMIKPFATAQMQQLDLAPAVWEALYAEARDFPGIANAVALVVEQ